METPKNKTPKYNHVLISLQDYMLTEKIIQHFLQPMSEFNKSFSHSTPVVKTAKDLIFFPKEKDSLFWCFYIMKFGDIKYEMLENKSLVSSKLYLDIYFSLLFLK